MGLMLGAASTELLKAFTSAKAALPQIDRLLHTIDDVEQRLELALGSALALKAQKKQGVVAVFIAHGSLTPTAYRRLLKPAAKFELPVIFVVLPRAGSANADTEAVVSRIAGKSGVPGIPVDAADSVALYRVVQESLGRARGGDGPVLIECIRWKTSGAASGLASDPLDHLQNFLIGRKICTSGWFRKAESLAVRRLKVKQRTSK